MTEQNKKKIAMGKDEFINVQSLLSKNDLVALRKATGKSTKESIQDAVKVFIRKENKK